MKDAPFLQGVQDSQGQGLRRSLTVAELARHKHLPTEFLDKLGLRDIATGVAIPYYDAAGVETFVKERTAPQAKAGSYWPKGTPLCAYGQWRLERARQSGFLIVVEGESDCWALWYHGLPALGLPGSGAARTLEADFLVDVPKLYVHREPDRGGDSFLEGIARHLLRIGYDGHVFELRMPGDIKDPADLHVTGGDQFRSLLEKAILASTKLDPAPFEKKATTKPTPAQRPLPDLNALALEVSFADVPPQQVKWLWPGRIPLGKVTILDGDPGLGKSFVTLDLAARVSRGLPMPFEDAATLPASNALVLSAEDAAGDTIRPRLVDAGADLARVFHLDEIPLHAPSGQPIEGQPPHPPAFPDDVPYLAELVRRRAAKLVIIDPLMAFLADKVNSNNDQNARRALLPLSKLAEASGAAFVVVRHLNKKDGGNSLYRGGGSIGIIGAARSGLLIAKDPDDPDRRVLAVTKSNLAKRARTLTFRLTEDQGANRVGWIGDAPHTCDPLLASKEPELEESSPALAEAVEFLQKTLAAGPLQMANIVEQANVLGIANRTLKRAKYRLGVQNLCYGDPTGKNGPTWSWVLPKGTK